MPYTHEKTSNIIEDKNTINKVQDLFSLWSSTQNIRTRPDTQSDDTNVFQNETHLTVRPVLKNVGMNTNIITPLLRSNQSINQLTDICQMSYDM